MYVLASVFLSYSCEVPTAMTGVLTLAACRYLDANKCFMIFMFQTRKPGFSSGLFLFLQVFVYLRKYLILGGLAFLCWKGIIPVHRMDPRPQR